VVARFVPEAVPGLMIYMVSIKAKSGAGQHRWGGAAQVAYDATMSRQGSSHGTMGQGTLIPEVCTPRQTAVATC